MMFDRFKFRIALIGAIVMGFVIIQSLLNSYKQGIRDDQAERLNKSHSDAVIRARSGIKVYAVIVSSLRAYFLNSENVTELELQLFLRDLLADLEFENDIVVNYISKDHTFLYVVTPSQIDAPKLKGKNVKDLRPESEVKKLDALMQSDEIFLFEPINLREGWAGLPFNFSVKNKNGKLLGYVAPVLNLSYLLESFYYGNSNENFVHSFQVNDSIDITRQVVYDDTEIFNANRDQEYYKNFNVPEDQFVFSEINVYNLNLKVGSAYKTKPKLDTKIVVGTYIWYALLSLLSFIALMQYDKSRKLALKLKTANDEIEGKNKVLENSILKIQTLIKEIHHRVKNNMHMIANLLSLQEDEYDDPKIIDALKRTKNRIQSMSLIHEKLKSSENLEDVNVKQYINRLVGLLEETISNKDTLPKKHIDVDKNLIFSSQTMECLGLVINELVTNSYEYAYKLGNDNMMKLSIFEENEGYTMLYIDNSPKRSEDFNLEKSESLGMQLIYILIGQLHGEVEYSYEKESTFKITFKVI